MRLGDLDALKSQLGKSTVTIIGYGKAVFLDKIYEIIDNAPTVELQMGRMTNGIVIPIERPTGEWIYDEKLCNWKCSNCLETPKTIGYVGSSEFMIEHFKYCNHCGAKMRGGGSR